MLLGIALPERFTKIVAEQFQEAMAYPVLDVPMYQPLVDISSELFLPNLNLIEPNSITLLETNQRFIEAYMVGLNHEFARELLWREYPTDQRGCPSASSGTSRASSADTSDPASARAPARHPAAAPVAAAIGPRRPRQPAGRRRPARGGSC